MSLFPEIFSYDRLYEAARETISPGACRLFDALNTRDFERVMELLKHAETVSTYYFRDAPTAEQLNHDRTQLRELLIRAIADRHPESRYGVPDAAYNSCWRFLSTYENLFTLNYDLLLYWTLMWRLEQLKGDDKRTFRFKDGFWTHEDERLYWAPLTSQAVFYLHGAVHIIRHGHRVHKLNLTDNRNVIMTQVRDVIDGGQYPLFVSEAASQDKLAQIKEESYLDNALKHLRDLRGHLVIMGSSIQEVDHHIWDACQQSSVEALYVGTRQQPGQPGYIKVREHIAAQIDEPRNRARRNIDIYLFDTTSAHVWDAPNP
jgi:hypothetical protein